MWPVSQTFLKALRTTHSVRYSTCVFTDPFTHQTTQLPFESGSNVTIDVTSRHRRVLSLTLPPLQSLFDVVSVPGGEITVTQTVRFIDGKTEQVPVGVFCPDQEGLDYTPGGTFTITAPDRWVQIERNRFGLSRSSVATNLTWQEIKRLVEGAWPNIDYPFPGWAAGSPGASATTKVGSVVWADGDRSNAISQLATANSLDVYFDAQGKAVCKPLPVLTTASTSVWQVDASASGVMVNANRQVDLSRVHNAVIVSSSASDIILTPVEVKHAVDPGTDPLSTLGPLGYRPAYYASPVVRTTAQATAAGKTILSRELSTAQQVSFTAVPNPALDGWDVVDVIYPPGDNGPRAVDHQMIEGLVIPLTPDGQQIGTLRSTRPTADDST